MSAGLIVWFTGLSGSGKSTIALETRKLLIARNISVEIIDGDELRKRVGAHLGFSSADIAESNRLAIRACQESQKRHDVVLVPRIAPSKAGRKTARDSFGENFIETYVYASQQTIEARDPKGLYARFRKGEGFAPIGLPGAVSFEAPDDPEILLDTDTCAAQTLALQLTEIILDNVPRAG